MLSAVIIDDEAHCIKTLQWNLQQYCSQKVRVVATFTNPQEALLQLPHVRPQVLFLDIEMPHLNGISLLQQWQPNHCAVIFTTAYDQYAIKAIKLNALDYLLKPIVKDELVMAVDKLIKQQAAILPAQVLALQEAHITRQPDKIAISTNQGLLFIRISQIIRVEAQGAYCQFIMQDGKKVLLSKPLSTAEELVAGPNFYRAHKSHLIQLSFVEKYIRGEGGEIIMADGASIALSRTKKDEFLQLFAKL